MALKSDDNDDDDELVYYPYISLTGQASSILHNRLNDTDMTAGKCCSFARMKWKPETQRDRIR